MFQKLSSQLQYLFVFTNAVSACLTDFPHSPFDKESACNTGDPSLNPGLGRSPGEGLGYPFQYSWASLVAQLVKNPPAMQETWVRSLDWEVPLEKGKVTHSSILAWRIPWTIVHGITNSWIQLSDFNFSFVLEITMQKYLPDNGASLVIQMPNCNFINISMCSY